MAKLPRPSAAPTRSSTTLPPRPAPKPIDYEAELRSPWYKSFRSKYLAVGVAIIAASGSLFGAQLKTTWQSYQAGKTRALAEGGHNPPSTEKTGATPAAGAVKDAATAARKATGEELSLSDLDRSIATLQTVRGQLVQRRIQEEMRLVKLRERVVERREAEVRRTQVAGPGR